MIKFSCPTCTKPFVVKDQLAGRKATCQGCKTELVIPKASGEPAQIAPKPAPARTAPLPPPDAEAVAAEAFADEPVKEEPKEVGVVKFACPQCDEPIELSAELAGKRAPCPSCRRIIKVPELIKQDPKDWRKVDKIPSAARRDLGPVPEGAWGSSSATVVSREALVEADAIPQVKERLTTVQKVNRGLAAAAVLAACGLLVWAGFGLWARNRQARLLTRALNAVESGTVRLNTEAAAEIQRAAAEYYLHAGNAEEALKRFRRARSLLTGEGSATADRDLALIDLVLSQLELGGDKEEAERGGRVKWDELAKDLGQTLRGLRTPEGQAWAVRAVTRKLVEKGQAELAPALAGQIAADDPAGMAALVGLVCRLLKQEALADRLAEEASRLLPSPNTPANPPASLSVPVVALLVASGKGERVGALLPANLPEPPAPVRIGTAQGLAVQGRLDQARNAALAPGTPLARLEALLAVAAVAADTKPESAREYVQEAVKLLSTDLKTESPSPWLLFELTWIAARTGEGEVALKMAQTIPDPGLRSRAQWAIVQERLHASTEPMAETIVQSVDKGTPSQARAVTALARHNARFGSDTQDWVDGLEPDWLRPFGYLGLALGLQDAKR